MSESNTPIDAGTWEGNAHSLTALLIERDALVVQLDRLLTELAAMTERAEKAELEISNYWRPRCTAADRTATASLAAKREAVEEIVERCAQLVINRVINRTMHTIQMNKLVADIRALPIETGEK